METSAFKDFGDESLRLGRYEALLFAIVLESALLQLRILEAKSDRSDFNDEPLPPYKEKLFRDRCTVSEMARATFAELLQGGHYTHLRTLLDDMRRARAHVTNLRETHKQLRLARKEAAQSCRLQRVEHQEKINAADHQAADLRDTLEDEACNSQLRLSYVERWQRARAELLEVSLQQASTTAPREQGARRLRQEERVHCELLRIFHSATQEYEASVQNWEVRYHTDLADINMRLLDRREQLRETLTKRKNLQEVYSVHAAEINAWLTFKKERAERLALEVQRSGASVCLQAWWRGVMVRRGLGAFKSLRAKKPPQKQGKKKG